MKLAFATLFTCTCAVSLDFDSYKAKFGKAYSSDAEESQARECWEANIVDIADRNANSKESGSDLIFAENSFSDQCFAEFAAQRMPLDQVNGACTKSGVDPYTKPYDENQAIDWRSKGYVNPVKDQGSCGSCWAFSAVAALEGAHFKATGELLSFSEQYLVSCDKADGNNGCGGGMPGEASGWVASNGIVLEKDYPYTAKDGSCDSTRPKSSARFSGFMYIDSTKGGFAPGGGEPHLLAALQNEGPIAITVNANSWHQYSGGVMSEGCSGGINHAVLAVGYSPGQWIVRNSWGSSWGEKGYIRLSYGKGTNCIDYCLSVLPIAVSPAPPSPPTPPAPPVEHCGYHRSEAECQGIESSDGARCLWCPAVISCLDENTFDRLVGCGRALV